MSPELEIVAIIATAIGSAVVAVMGDRRVRDKNGGNGSSHIVRDFARHVGEDERWKGEADGKFDSMARDIEATKASIIRLNERREGEDRRRPQSF